jgi:hypothetical protein
MRVHPVTNGFDHHRPVVESGAVVLAKSEPHVFENTLNVWSSKRVAAVLRALAVGGRWTL